LTLLPTIAETGSEDFFEIVMQIFVDDLIENKLVTLWNAAEEKWCTYMIQLFFVVADMPQRAVFGCLKSHSANLPCIYCFVGSSRLWCSEAGTSQKYICKRSDETIF